MNLRIFCFLYAVVLLAANVRVDCDPFSWSLLHGGIRQDLPVLLLEHGMCR